MAPFTAVREGFTMESNPLFYTLLLLLSFVWLYCLLYVLWPDKRAACLLSPYLALLRRKRSLTPQPFTGLIHKPLCDACQHAADESPQVPPSPPPVVTFTRGRTRRIDTQQQFCPNPDCAYYGWAGRGNIRTNG